MSTHHSLFDFFFLLLCEAVWDAVLAGLRAQQQLPQLAHEQPRILAVQESRQVNLHFLWTRELGAEDTDRERKHSIVINLFNLSNQHTPGLVSNITSLIVYRFQ